MSYLPDTPKTKILNALSYLPHPICRTFHRKLRRAFMERAQLEYEAVLDSLGPDDIVLALGANYGTFTQAFAQTGAKVHAFEPDPVTFEILTKNCAGLKNVTLHPKAVSDQAGTLTLTRMLPRRGQGHAASSQGSSIVFDHSKMDKGDTVEVEVIDLLAFLQGLKKKPKLIKMDIEGAEWVILESIYSQEALDLFETLFVETHERIDWSKLPLFRELRAKAAAHQHPRINLFWV